MVRHGDVVRLRQGSIRMLVLRVEGDQAICTWLCADNDRMETTYPIKLLRVVGRIKEVFS